MKIYKLTDFEMRTRCGFQWELGKWYEASGKGKLCGPGYLHAYSHPLVAVFMSPIHGATAEYTRIFEGEAEGDVLDETVKIGATRMRILREVKMPKVTTVQRVAFGIYAALEVCNEPKFVRWAQDWLSGEDRTEAAAGCMEGVAGYAAAAACLEGVEESGYVGYVTSAVCLREAAACSASHAVKSVEAARVGGKNIKFDIINIAKKSLEVI